MQIRNLRLRGQLRQWGLEAEPEREMQTAVRELTRHLAPILGSGARKVAEETGLEGKSWEDHTEP